MLYCFARQRGATGKTAPPAPLERVARSFVVNKERNRFSMGISIGTDMCSSPFGRILVIEARVGDLGMSMMTPRTAVLSKRLIERRLEQTREFLKNTAC